MSVLVAKEVRLLLPAWAAGLLLAFVPLWIMPPVLAIAMTTFAGGLWTTLLLRQVASAFWFCVLVPSVIQMIVTACGGSEMVGIASLAVYSIAAFLWARRYFFRMQESGWTGGEISIAGWADRDSTDANSRSFRPFMALCWKEVQLHQFNLF